MTNEELKKKIVEILDNNIRWQPYYYISRGIVYEDDLKNIADALIAEGLCDKNTLDERYQTLMAAGFVQMASLRLDLEKVLHRAEVAERALKLAEKLGKLCAPAKDYIKQAEKELAEGKND